MQKMTIQAIHRSELWNFTMADNCSVVTHFQFKTTASFLYGGLRSQFPQREVIVPYNNM